MTGSGQPVWEPKEMPETGRGSGWAASQCGIPFTRPGISRVQDAEPALLLPPGFRAAPWCGGERRPVCGAGIRFWEAAGLGAALPVPATAQPPASHQAWPQVLPKPCSGSGAGRCGRASLRLRPRVPASSNSTRQTSAVLRVVQCGTEVLWLGPVLGP